VIWNALKRAAAVYTPAEREELFFGTAQRAYRLSPGLAQIAMP
jgi:hypothetical protein